VTKTVPVKLGMDNPESSKPSAKEESGVDQLGLHRLELSDKDQRPETESEGEGGSKQEESRKGRPEGDDLLHKPKPPKSWIQRVPTTTAEGAASFSTNDEFFSQTSSHRLKTSSGNWSFFKKLKRSWKSSRVEDTLGQAEQVYLCHSTEDLPSNSHVQAQQLASISSLPAEVLEKVFQLLPLPTLQVVVLVCRRWRELGELPQFWTWLNNMLKRGNLVIVPIVKEMRKLKTVKKLVMNKRMVTAALLEVMARQAEIEELVLTNKMHCSHQRQLCQQCLSYLSSTSGLGLNLVKPNDLANSLSQLRKVGLNGVQLTEGQVSELLATSLAESSKLASLDLSHNDMSGIDPFLLSLAVSQLDEINLYESNLNECQVKAIVAALTSRSKLRVLIAGGVSCGWSSLAPASIALATNTLQAADLSFLLSLQVDAILSKSLEVTSLKVLLVRWTKGKVKQDLLERAKKVIPRVFEENQLPQVPRVTNA